MPFPIRKTPNTLNLSRDEALVLVDGANAVLVDSRVPTAMLKHATTARDALLRYVRNIDARDRHDARKLRQEGNA